MFIYIHTHVFVSVSTYCDKGEQPQRKPASSKVLSMLQKAFVFETCVLFQVYSHGAHPIILCMVASSITKVRASLYVEKSQDSR